jgi:hypothetical protein
MRHRFEQLKYKQQRICMSRKYWQKMLGAAPMIVELTEIVKSLLEEWLKNPKEMAKILGIDENELASYTPEEMKRH